LRSGDQLCQGESRLLETFRQGEITAHRSPDAPTVKQMVATHGAHIEAIERYLGIPADTLYRADTRAVNTWIGALRGGD